MQRKQFENAQQVLYVSTLNIDATSTSCMYTLPECWPLRHRMILHSQFVGIFHSKKYIKALVLYC